MKKGSLFTVITLFLIILISFFSVTTAKCISKNDKELKETYYQTMEKNYLNNLKLFLEEQGFYHSGVTMTRRENEEGEREYHILIHNDRISRLDSLEQERLIKQILETLKVPEQCHFFHEFLVIKN